jgi:hypothetical protein
MRAVTVRPGEARTLRHGKALTAVVGVLAGAASAAPSLPPAATSAHASTASTASSTSTAAAHGAHARPAVSLAHITTVGPTGRGAHSAAASGGGSPTPRAMGWGSSNWSGYVAGRGSATSVSGQWNVPAVVPTGSPTHSATRTGIDGFDNGSLIQAGTEQDSANYATTYSAWWTTSALGYYEQKIPYPVAIHDLITVSIAQHGAVWTIDITDAGAWSYHVTVSGFSTPGATAEWIMEAPYVDGQTAQMTRYTPFDFDLATVNGEPAQLTAAEGGQMYQPGQAVSTPSGPDGDTDGFTMDYGPLGVPAGTT